MTGLYEGKRVLVTAAGAGIGRTIAEHFLAQGAAVHVCDILSDRLAEFQQQHPTLGTTVTDVSDPQQVAALFEAVEAHLGGLDILINNAGISGPTGPVEDLTPEGWERTMAVNINGQFYCTRLAVPLLKAAGGGSIVNISSTAGLFGYPNRSPYAASKWAVIGFTKTLAMELGPFKIRVNAICPGSVEGPRMDAVIAAESRATGIAPETLRAGYTSQVSMRTFITTHDLANMILFICSDAGRYISGQALSVDGHTETLRAD